MFNIDRQNSDEQVGNDNNLQVSNYRLSAPKGQLGWLNWLTSQYYPPPVTAKHRLVKLQEINLSRG